VQADTAPDPPLVIIYQWDGLEEFLDIEELDVDVGEDFILWAVAYGDTPFVYSWYLDGELIASGGDAWRLDMAFDETGVFVLLCDVVDAVNQHGHDSVVVTVSEGPVAREPAAWSAIKATYR
jgi:hypothetical protein